MEGEEEEKTVVVVLAELRRLHWLVLEVQQVAAAKPEASRLHWLDQEGLRLSAWRDHDEPTMWRFHCRLHEWKLLEWRQH
mmetsp:Transcript_90103/g.156134  ORF Transcript_90103/g.156134 Transcript_90103/m.156134 type:complete len:80 (-) Transcript_90103:131-370(-)